MPLVDYDYGYYNRPATKVNRSTNVKRATNNVSSISASQRAYANQRNNYSNRYNEAYSRNREAAIYAKERYNRTKQTLESTRESYNRTRQATREQVRQAVYEEPKTKKQVSQAKRKKTNDIEIPAMVNKRRVETEQVKKVNTKQNNKNEIKQKPAEMKLNKPEVSAEQKKLEQEKALNRVRVALLVIFGFALAFFICYRYSLINERFNDVEKIKKEFETAVTVNEQLQADIDSQTDLAYIENYAKYQLGMQKPSNSQIKYVNVEKQDKIITPISIEEETEKTWFDTLYETVLSWFE